MPTIYKFVDGVAVKEETKLIKTRRIVCAANRFYGDTIVCGARHYDEAMRSVLPHLKDAYSSANVEQGFINTWGEFLSREEAWMVASYNDQIIRIVGSQDVNHIGVYGTELFSENLY